MSLRRKGSLALGTSRLAAAPFDPTTISGLIGWYDAYQSTKWQDAARTVAAVSDADPVAAWDDLSGNGNHLTQATTTKRPLLKLAIQNGLPVLRFDGVDDFLSKSLSDQAQPNTVFIVAKTTSTSGTPFYFNGLATGGQNGAFIQSAKWASWSGAFFDTTPDSADTSWHQLTWLWNGASSFIRHDGTQRAGAGGSNALGSGVSVGASWDASSPFPGDIAAVLIYHGDKTANLSYLEGGLKTRWGTP